LFLYELRVKEEKKDEEEQQQQEKQEETDKIECTELTPSIFKGKTNLQKWLLLRSQSVSSLSLHSESRYKSRIIPPWS
jgi:hypothetical protein